MSSDPRNPYSQPLPTPPPLPASWQQASSPAPLSALAGGGGLGSSLAQSARLNQLNSARAIMFLVGILTIGLNVLQYAMIDDMVNRQIDAEVAKLTRPGIVINQAKLAEVKESAKRTVRFVAIGLIGVGVLYIVFGFIVKKYPVPVTIIALVIYVGLAIIFAILNQEPIEISFAMLLKIGVIVALVKAVQSAIAYQKELNTQHEVVFAGLSG